MTIIVCQWILLKFHKLFASCPLVTDKGFLMSVFGQVFLRSGLCDHLCRHGAAWLSKSCSWVRVAARDANRCHRGMTVPAAAEASQWERLCLSHPAVCQRPLAALALLLSPGVPDRHIVSAMINYRPDEMWSSGNVTRMTWACQCGPAGWTVSHTDIWKDMEHQMHFQGKNILLPELVSFGFYVIL